VSTIAIEVVSAALHRAFVLGFPRHYDTRLTELYAIAGNGEVVGGILLHRFWLEAVGYADEPFLVHAVMIDRNFSRHLLVTKHEAHDAAFGSTPKRPQRFLSKV
jgi:hypothetical protein